MLWISKQKFFNKYLPLALSVVLLVVGLGTYFIIQKSKTTEAAWYSSASGTWNYRQKIVIDHNKVSTASSTTLSNFPVLINTTNVTFKSYANGGHVASSTGADILFTDSTGTTKLAHEIEKYTPTTGELIAWVQVSSLSPMVDTVIYMYYGGPSVTSQQNATGVWDSNYKGVWHLADSTNALTADSSSTGNTLSQGSGTAVATTTGQIDGAGLFAGTGNSDLQRNSPTGFPTGTAALTQGSWFKLNSASFSGGPIIVSHGDNNTGGTRLSTTVDSSCSGIGVEATNKWSFYQWTPDTNWHYLVAVLPTGATTIGEVKVYLDGNLLTSRGSCTLSDVTLNINNQQVVLGAIAGAPVAGAFPGRIDEARVSNTDRSYDWIKTEYNNQNSPSTFHYFTGEESRNQAQVNGSWYNASWQYRKKITINHEQVSGTTTLANFPVLVSFTDPLLKYTSSGGHVASSTGGDILFTSSNGVLLNFEREYYASTTGQLVAWVQIPSLSPTADTVIYAYYGNVSATDMQSAASTWDSNFKGVYHLSNGTTLSIRDSQGVNNGTSAGTMTATSGFIDGAALGTSNINDAAIDIANNVWAFSSFTAEAWVNLNGCGFSTNEPTIIGSMGSSNWGWRLSINSSCKLVWILGTSGGTASTVPASALATGSWYHVAGTFDGTRLTAYINGVATSTVVNALVPNYGTAPASIGHWPWSGGKMVNGKIDEAKVSNTARTASWIATEYNNQSSPSAFASVAGEETQSQTTFNSSWYSSQWSYRKPIVIDRNKVNQATGTTTPLTNFPVLVSLTDTDLKNNASSTGADIFFTSSDGLTKLNYEREYYASSTGQLIAWVQIPSLSNSSDTVLYMYFGNSSATDQQAASSVWDSNAQNVWHLADAGNATSTDSTSNGNNGTNNSLTSTTGQIDGAGSFNGSSKYIVGPASTSLKMTGAVTVSAWVIPGAVDGAYHTIAGRWQVGVDQHYILQLDSDNLFGFYFDYNGSDASSGQLNVKSTTVPTINRPYLVTSVFDPTTTSLKMYINGVLENTTTNAGLTTGVAGTVEFTAGSKKNVGGTYFEYWNGTLDEVKVSNAARTADWINTEYQNQFSPSTFAAVGGLQTANRGSSQGGVGTSNRGWYNKSWQYRMPITISHNMVGSSSVSSLTNFPVLISTTTANLKVTGSGGGVANSSGNDILFTDNDGVTKLNHEVEKYTSATGELVAWVKVPTLSTSTDHTLYIYYGNSSASSQQNVTGVWDSDYKGVWHLPNGTTLSGADSVSGGHTMTSAGGVTATSTGQIDGAGVFNGVGNSGYMGTSGFAISSNPSVFTISAWIKITAGSLGNRNTIFTTTTGNTANNWSFEVGNGAGANTASLIYPGVFMIAVAYPTDGALHHLQYTRTSNASCGTIYLDGIAQSTVSTAGCANTFSDNGEAKLIGTRNGSTQMFTGLIDDVRVSSIARSADWVKTEYLNQSSPGTYVTWSSQQTSATATAAGANLSWPLSNGTWTTRKTITIDRTKVSQAGGTTLTDFPVLISVNGTSGITDNEFKSIDNGGKVGRTDGKDMVFTTDTGYVLPYELEKYSSSTGETIAWVKIPSLSPARDTQLYVYLGNPSASDQSSTTGVWDSNYKAVWHLADGGNSTSTDSTLNQNNGANTSTSLGTGQVDGAATTAAGSNNRIIVPNSSSLAVTSFTIELWWKPGALLTWSGPINNRIAGQNGFQVVNDTNSGTVYTPHLVIYNGAGEIAQYKAASYSLTYPSSSFIHYVWTYGGGSASLYINGTAQTVATSGITSYGLSGFNIGNGYGNAPGTYDEVKLSNSVRSADWIKTEYNNQNSPSTFYSITGANAATRPATTPMLKSRGGVKFR